MQSERAYSWDEGEIQQPNEGSDFVVLPAGTYPFEITGFERGRFTPGPKSKLPECPKAIVSVRVTGDMGASTVKHNLYLHSSCEGFLCQFFTSIGHRKSGEPLRMAWDRIVGCTGMCKVSVRKGTGQYEGKEFNEIKTFLDPAIASHNSQASQEPAYDEDAPF